MVSHTKVVWNTSKDIKNTVTADSLKIPTLWKKKTKKKNKKTFWTHALVLRYKFDNNIECCYLQCKSRAFISNGYEKLAENSL